MNCTKETVDMQELLKRGMGELLYDGEEGAVVRVNGGGTVISDIADGNRLLGVLEELGLSEAEQIMVKDTECYRTLREKYGFPELLPCSQWIYDRKEPPFVPDCDVRPLGEEYAQEAASHYHLVADSLAYIQARIAAGQMWGLFEDGKLAGFIGTHSEGAMGMLEIFPDYRRKGYGYALEAWLIAWHLKQGWTAYCHVIEGNESSVYLQEKLGLERCRLPALWLS